MSKTDEHQAGTKYSIFFFMAINFFIGLIFLNIGFNNNLEIGQSSYYKFQWLFIIIANVLKI